MTSNRGRHVTINQIEDHTHFPAYPATKDGGILHFIPIREHRLSLTTLEEDRQKVRDISKQLMSNVYAYLTYTR